MPKMVTIEVNPGFKADGKVSAQEFAQAQKTGSKLVSYQSGLEAIRHSGGMYRIAAEKKAPVEEAAPRSIEDMERDDLLALAIGLGMKTDKPMKKSDIVTYVKTRMDKIEILPEDTDA
jgi:hypothetical protein